VSCPWRASRHKAPFRRCRELLGHKRATTSGPVWLVAVTSGQAKCPLSWAYANYTHVAPPLPSVSQAENAGSIPVARSHKKSWSGHMRVKAFEQRR